MAQALCEIIIISDYIFMKVINKITLHQRCSFILTTVMSQYVPTGNVQNYKSIKYFDQKLVIKVNKKIAVLVHNIHILQSHASAYKISF